MKRRTLLHHAALGLGSLTIPGWSTATDPVSPPNRRSAKRMIFLCMRGAPSQLDTFSYKPKLMADHGKPGPRPGSTLLGSRWKFAQHGKSGHWMSELFPQLATCADELCFLHGMQTDVPAHPQSYLRMHTGSSQFVRPSLGAWVQFGLGSANPNLPGFISLAPPSGLGGAQNYGSAFLPAKFQGTRIGVEKRAIANAQVANLASPLSPTTQRAELDLIAELNRLTIMREVHEPQIEGLKESYELAFRMQKDMPTVMDLSKESDTTRRLYGIGDEATDDFGRKCLLARRMMEAGVRFVEVNHGDWDHHFNLGQALPAACAAIDRPLRGLLTDLRSRGLLDDTLVLWGGEFGRTPHAEGQDGRDHHVKGFTTWMAGGGVKAGTSYGSTDDYGYDIIGGKVDIHDWHATILALLGLDHERLTYRHAGRDFRLTDVHGRVVREIIG